MNIAVGGGLKIQSWRDVYQTAICEADLNKLPGQYNAAIRRLISTIR